MIAGADFLAHTEPIFNKLDIVKCTEQYLLSLASIMWDYDHELIPKIFGLINPIILTRQDLLNKVNLHPVFIIPQNLVSILFGMKVPNYLIN